MADHAINFTDPVYTTLPALSVLQPWAWLLACGHKDIENRDWQPHNYGLKFRGPFLIHTGLKFDGEDDANDWPYRNIERPEHFDRGGIVGVAEIMDVVTESKSPWFFGKYGLVIRNARPLPFRPCVGQLGFFRPDYTKAYVGPKPKAVREKPVKGVPPDLFNIDARRVE